MDTQTEKNIRLLPLSLNYTEDSENADNCWRRSTHWCRSRAPPSYGKGNSDTMRIYRQLHLQ